MIKQGPKKGVQKASQSWLTVERAKALVKEHLSLNEDREINQEALKLIHQYHRRQPELKEVIEYLREKAARAKSSDSEKENQTKQQESLPITITCSPEVKGKELSLEQPTFKEFTYSDAVNHLKSLLQGVEEEILHKGANYLVEKKAIFRTLSNPFTESFIKNNLLGILRTQHAPILQSLTEPVSMQQPVRLLYDYDSVNKISKNIKTFQELSCAGTTKVASRYNQFVLVLGIPDLPRRHSGVDDSCHPTAPISFECSDLLQRGKNTLNFIHHKENAVRPCPNLLFLRKPIKIEEDALTKKLHENHTLDAFTKQIINETQAPIEFHIAGHSSREEAGSFEKRFSPEDLAELFDEIVMASELKEVLLNKQLTFVFHTCNSAYISDLTGNIREKILKESLIGRFFQKMRDLKYNLTVTGYRGFYSTMTSGAGATVSAKIDEDQTTTYSAKSAEVVIAHKGATPIVSLPEGKGLNFTVYFDPSLLSRSRRPQ